MQVNILCKLVWLIGLFSGISVWQHNFPFWVTNGINETEQQATVIRGVVLDEVLNQPLGFANITVPEARLHTQANSEGKFELRIPAWYKQGSMQITTLGYEPRTIALAGLIQENEKGTLKIYLKPAYKGLREVEISAASRKWKEKKIGFNIDKGTRFHHQFSPLDTVVKNAGHEIGNRFELKKYPAHLQSISFGLAGSGNVKAIIGLNIYTLKNNLPDKRLLPKEIVLRIPPHHTGWITVDLAKYNVILKEDFAVSIEWLSETNQLNKSSLMAFANHPKGQVTYSRASEKQPWKVLKPTLTSVNSIGLYVTVLQ